MRLVNRLKEVENMKRCFVALFLSVSLLLTACSPTQSSNGDTVTVTDALGREVNFALDLKFS